jgi:hypothetical protein
MATTVRAQADRATRPTASDQSMQPWHFFVLAGLACATAVTFMARGQGWTPVILLTLLMGGAAIIGLATLRMVRPLVGPFSDRTSMVGQRTRVALEREKLLTLRAIKDLEFDKAMRKVSDDDFRDMSAKLRARVGRLMLQLDAGAGYREQVERDLVKRLGGVRAVEEAAPSTRACANCSTANDTDAKFCKQCGSKL